MTSSRILFLLASAVPLAAAFPGPGQAQTTYEQTGRWTSPNDIGADWPHRQWHMALLRGDGNAHSYLLTWHFSDASQFQGSLWRWNEPLPTDEFEVFPGATLFTDPVQPGTPGVDVGCSGHTTLSDGSLFIVGGQEEIAGLVATNGTPNLHVFDRATKSWRSDLAWTEPMDYRRYYPSVTMLGSGRLLAVHGWQYHHQLVFGGRTNPSNQSTARDEIQRLIGLAASQWDTPETKQAGEEWPDPRWQHTVAARIDEENSNFSRIILFGGVDNLGEVRNDTWLLTRSQSWEHTVESYTWELIATGPRRTEHGAIVAADGSMYAYGGLDDAFTAQEGVRRLFQIGNNWFWQTIATSSSGPDQVPGARYNHTVAYDYFDPDGASSLQRRNRILVFGGKGEGGALANNEVYALDLAATPTPTWQKLTLGPGSAPAPVARHGHSMLADTVGHWRTLAEQNAVAPKWSRLVLYGGESESGRQGDAWLLWINPNDPNQVEWQAATPPAQAGDPVARFEHGASWIRHSSRLLIHGGNTGSPTQSDGAVWALDVRWPVPSELQAFAPTWTPQPGASGLGPALTGHTPIQDIIANEARLPEIYDPTLAQGSRWATLGANRRSFFYPDLFLLPSGNVFGVAPFPWTVFG